MWLLAGREGEGPGNKDVSIHQNADGVLVGPPLSRFIGFACFDRVFGDPWWIGSGLRHDFPLGIRSFATILGSSSNCFLLMDL